MNSSHRPPLASRWRTIAASALGLTLAPALAFGTATPAMAATTPTLTSSIASVITLPADDGFNDDATLQVRSNSALTVSVFLIEKKTGHLVARLESALKLAKKGSVYRAAVGLGSDSLTREELAAGTYLVRVKNNGARALKHDALLRIGSGRATKVVVRASESALFPFDDGYLDTLHSRVSAIDETGTAVPFSGTIVVKSKSKSRSAKVASADGASKMIAVPVTGLATGTALVTAKVTGPTGSARSSAAAKLSLNSTRVASASVRSSARTVYPVADGYGDFISVRFAAKTSTGRTIPATGTITVARGKTVVKKWAISSSAQTSHYWDGRTGSKIVPGTYTLTARVRGVEGAAVRSTSTVHVSAKRLVTKTATVDRTAVRVLPDFSDYDAKKRGACSAQDGALTCRGYGAGRSTTRSLYAYGSPAVPSAVRATVRYRTPTMRVTAVVRSLRGSAVWAYGGSASGALHRGTRALGWVSLGGSPTSTAVSVSLHKNTAVTIERFRFEYHYYVLR